MTKLSCSARNCDRNMEGLCTASNILVEAINSTVSRDTYCSTYIDQDGEVGLNSAVGDSYMMNMVQGFSASAFDIAMSPYISCNAVNCNYNLSGVCVAREVYIYGEANGVQGNMCDTFIHK